MGKSTNEIGGLTMQINDLEYILFSLFFLNLEILLNVAKNMGQANAPDRGKS